MNPSQNPALMFSEATLALMTRLQRHPELQAQVAALLDEVENRAGTLNTGDDAEDAIVARLHQFGVAAELQGVAEPLLGVDQQGPAEGWLAGPLRLLE